MAFIGDECAFFTFSSFDFFSSCLVLHLVWGHLALLMFFFFLFFSLGVAVCFLSIPTYRAACVGQTGYGNDDE